MGIQSDYVVNEDGSVTKVNGNKTNYSENNNFGNSSGKNGCFWTIIIVIVIVIGIIVAIHKSSKTSAAPDDTFIGADSLVVDVDTAVVDADEPISTTYLDVSDDEIFMDADGGDKDITVSTDGDWNIDVNVADWGHLTKYSNSVTLTLDRNTSTSSRRDYFVLKSGSYTKRVNITQYGNTTPSGNITRVWVEHNVYNNGVKGMKIHASYEVENMKGETVYMYTYYYYGDNRTPLKNSSGNNLSISSSGVAPYDNTTFNDSWHFMSYSSLNMQPGYGSIDLSFDVAIKDENGEQLDRNENNRFTLNEN